MTLARTWRAQIREGRVEDYLTFLQERSFEMFRTLPGCLGVVYLRNEYDVTVVSVWADKGSVDALETSQLYNATVAELQRREILDAPDPAVVYGCDGFIIRGLANDN